MTTSQRTIFFAERDENIVAVVHGVLTDAGYEVVSSETLDDAVAALPGSGATLVLTDSFSNRHSEALANVTRVLHAAGETPVVFITAHAFTEHEVLAAGFAAYIQKPFELDHLLQIVAACLPT